MFLFESFFGDFLQIISFVSNEDEAFIFIALLVFGNCRYAVDIIMSVKCLILTQEQHNVQFHTVIFIYYSKH